MTHRHPTPTEKKTTKDSSPQKITSGGDYPIRGNVIEQNEHDNQIICVVNP